MNGSSTLNENHQITEDQRQTLARTLKRAETALDDWINTYAYDMCDQARVKEAVQRISDEGGTLCYIAKTVQEVRAARKWLEE